MTRANEGRPPPPLVNRGCSPPGKGRTRRHTCKRPPTSRTLVRALAHLSPFPPAGMRATGYKPAATHMHAMSGIWIARGQAFLPSNGPQPRRCRRRSQRNIVRSPAHQECQEEHRVPHCSLNSTGGPTCGCPASREDDTCEIRRGHVLPALERHFRLGGLNAPIAGRSLRNRRGLRGANCSAGHHESRRKISPLP